MRNVRQDYLEWLVEYVGADRGDRTYRLLLKELHKREFYAVNPRDENRAGDGKDLRMAYLDEFGCPGDELNGPCSMLEFIIGLANRMAFSLYSSHYGHNVEGCFWEIVDNLGFGECSDESFGEPWFDPYYIDEVCGNVCERRFDFYGRGGPFPLVSDELEGAWRREDIRLDALDSRLEVMIGRGVPDQRALEFYVQMEYYLLVHYPDENETDDGEIFRRR